MKMSFKLIKFCLKIIFCKRIILKPMKFHSFYIRLINQLKTIKDNIFFNNIFN